MGPQHLYHSVCVYWNDWENKKLCAHWSKEDVNNSTLSSSCAWIFLCILFCDVDTWEMSFLETAASMFAEGNKEGSWIIIENFKWFIRVSYTPSSANKEMRSFFSSVKSKNWMSSQDDLLSGLEFKKILWKWTEQRRKIVQVLHSWVMHRADRIIICFMISVWRVVITQIKTIK